MRSLFDEGDTGTQVTGKLSFTHRELETWAEARGLSISRDDSPVGEIAVVGGKIAIGIDPVAESSQQLRDLQAEYSARGVSLYFVFPWEKNTAKLFSHFESKLGMDTRKYAAKRLLLSEIPNDTGNSFMKSHHIQGAAGGAGKVSLALSDKSTGEILAVQQFSRYRFAARKGAGSISESTDWEGLRLCFLPGVQIHGAASRFQKFFEERYQPQRIISYISASHSDGRYKAAQGFTDITDWNQLSYMWFLPGDPGIVPIVDKNGERRVNDPDLCRKYQWLSPVRMAGAFGKGVGQTFYGGKLGSRKQLREHPENGLLVDNDSIMEAIGYRKWHTPGQYKWVKTLS